MPRSVTSIGLGSISGWTSSRLIHSTLLNGSPAGAFVLLLSWFQKSKSCLDSKYNWVFGSVFSIIIWRVWRRPIVYDGPSYSPAGKDTVASFTSPSELNAWIVVVRNCTRGFSPNRRLYRRSASWPNSASSKGSSSDPSAGGIPCALTSCSHAPY